MGKRYSYLVYSERKLLMTVTLSEKAAKNVDKAQYYVKQLENAQVVLPFDNLAEDILSAIKARTSVPYERVSLDGVWKQMDFQPRVVPSKKGRRRQPRGRAHRERMAGILSK